MKNQRLSLLLLTALTSGVLCASACGSSDQKKNPRVYEAAGQGGAPEAEAGVGGEPRGLGGQLPMGGAAGAVPVAAGAGGVVEVGVSGAAGAGGAGGAPLSGCSLGDPCCADNVCQENLACLGTVCSCVGDLSGDYMLRTDGVAFHTFINDTAQSAVINADTGMPLHGITSIMGSGYHGCAALDSGEVRCWPLVADNTGNNVGQLGNGTIGGTQPVLSATLVKVSASMNLTNVVAIGADSATYYAPTTTCAAQQSGAMYCWGGGAAKIINAATTSTPFATQILTAQAGPALTGVTQVALGYYHACALTNGKVRCWGLSDGTGATAAYPAADIIGIPGTVAKIGAGYAYSCALNDAGSVYCWGDNTGSKLGIGDPAAVGYSSAVPTRAKTSANAFLDGVVDMAIAYGGVCVVRTDHTVWCWGGGLPFAKQLKNAAQVNVTDAVKVSTPFGPDAPRYVTESGVLVSQGNQLTPNCSAQE